MKDKDYQPKHRQYPKQCLRNGHQWVTVPASGKQVCTIPKCDAEQTIEY